MDEEAGYSICLEQSLSEPLDQVYAAWTRPDRLKAWLRTEPGGHTELAWVELKPGGAYHLRLRRADGTSVDYRGILEEVQPQQRLCLTLPAYGLQTLETRLELDFAPEGRGTLLALVQDGLRDRKMVREAEAAWQCAFASLARELPMIARRR